MRRAIENASEIRVGDKYYYQGIHTMEKGQLYAAEVLEIYQHHIVMSIMPVSALMEDVLHFTEIVPYRWSIAKIDIGVTENLYRREIA